MQVELLLAQLAPGDLLIFRAGGHELRVSALAHQPAVVQHQDLIGVEDGGNALCHDDHGGVVGLFLQRTAQGDIRLVVKGRETVVEQIDLRLLGNGAGDGEPLLLAAGYVGVSLGDGGMDCLLYTSDAADEL